VSDECEQRSQGGSNCSRFGVETGATPTGSIAEPILERFVRELRFQLHAPLSTGPTNHFLRHADQLDVGSAWPGNTPVSPAVLKFVEGEPFEIDGDLYHVERLLASGVCPQADVLILRACEHGRRQERLTRRALQVRDLETPIDQEHVEDPVDAGARQSSLTQAWCREGCDLDSLGIILGDDA
jgi:hypothetical protein